MIDWKRLSLRVLKSWWTWVVTVLLAVIGWSLREGRTPWIFTKTLECVTSAYGKTASFLGGDLTVSRWWYWILIVVFLLAVLYPCSIYARHKLRSTYWGYTTDTFRGVLFRWQWSKQGAHAEGEPYKIKAYCRNCDLALDQKMKRQRAVEMRDRKPPDMYYWCSDCKLESEHISVEEVKELIMRVKRERWP